MKWLKFFLIILLILLIVFLWFLNKKTSFIDNAIPKKTMALQSQPLSNMPVPSTPVKLVYNYERKTKIAPQEYIDWAKGEFDASYIERLKNIKESTENGIYIYCGSDKRMAFYISSDKLYYYNDGINIYGITNIYFDKAGKKYYNYKTDAMFSIMVISEAFDTLELRQPLFGLYQPGQFIFLNSNLSYDDNGRITSIEPKNIKFEYNDKGQVSSINNIALSYKFNNYKYFESIDMTIPTEILWTNYRFIPNTNQRFERKSEKITLVSAKKIEDKGIDFADVEKPSKTIMITDARSNNNVTYEYNQSMGTIDEVTKINVKKKREVDVTDKTPILTIVIRTISIIFMLLIIYKIVIKKKKEK